MRAGNSIAVNAGELAWRKYPHARGEQGRNILFARHSGEIPPCARGTGDRECAGRFAYGNTPMRAGNRLPASPTGGAGGKYPHARGEQRFTFTRPPADAEIPPCARGTAMLERNTRLTERKYPHARGEQQSLGSTRILQREIPPCARGTDCLTWSFIGGGPGNNSGTEFQIRGSVRDMRMHRILQPCQLPPLKFISIPPSCLHKILACHLHPTQTHPPHPSR